MIDLDPKQLALVKDILATHVPGVEVRAFGSRVNGKPNPYSDLDLALVGEAPIDRQLLEGVKDAFANSNLPIQVDVLDWNDISPSFRKVIEKNFEVIRKSTQEPARHTG